jgi:DNA-binding transcriptional MerR regulator
VTRAPTDRSHLSIGEVLSLLQDEFPDVTISKIRFLESQGLLDPERTPSGYRKFYETDIERLRWILRQQKDHYLPLKVIKDRLDDLGHEPEPPQPERRDRSDRSDRSDRRRRESERQRGRTRSAPAPFPIDERLVAQADPRMPVAPDDRLERERDRAERERDRADRERAAPDRRGERLDLDGGGRPDHGDHELPGADDVRTGGRPTRAGPPGPAGPVGPVNGIAEPAPGQGPSPGAVPPDGLARSTNGTSQSAPAHAAPAHPPAPVPGPAPAPSPARAPAAPVVAPMTGAPDLDPPATPVSLTIEELAEASGMGVRDLRDLERFGLLEGHQVGDMTYYDGDALVVARTAAGFLQHGIEARHLRTYKVAVDREAGLFEQIVLPLLKQRNPEAHKRAARTLAELVHLGEVMRGVLLRRELRDNVGP